MPENIAYAGSSSVITLRGPSAQVLELERTGAKQLQWAPNDRRAMDLELRMALISHAPYPGVAPFSPVLVRVSLGIGHGAYVWPSPPQPPPFASGQQIYEDWVLPGRGALWRVNSRELTIKLQAVSTVAGGAPPLKTLIAVSVQPGNGMHRPMFPLQQFERRVDPLVRLPALPLEANEMRVFNPATGLPFPAATATLFFVDAEFNGSSVDANTFADYRPIPIHAVGYSVGLTGGPPFAMDSGAAFR